MENKNPEEKHEGAIDDEIGGPFYSDELNELIVISDTENNFAPVVVQEIINNQLSKAVDAKKKKELNKPKMPVPILSESLLDTTFILQLDSSDFSMLLDATVISEPPKKENDKLDSLIITADEKELENEISMVKAVKIEEPTVQVKKDVEAEVRTIEDGLMLNKIKTKNDKKNDKGKVAAAPEAASVKASKDKMEDDGKSASSRTLWVLNASCSMKAYQLKQHLVKFGKVTTAKIVTDGERCFGYVVMQRSEHVQNCIKNLNGVQFNGRKIFLSRNRPTKSAISKAPVNQSMKKPEMCPRRHFNDQHRQVVREEVTLRRDYIREKQEKERLKRRLIEAQRRTYEERKSQGRNDERNRNLEFKLDQKMKKLQMERELFEKEVLRLDKERHKIEKNKWNLLREKSRLEESILQAKNERKRKTFEQFDSKTKVQKYERKQESSGERRRSHERHKYSSPRRYEEKDLYKDRPKIRLPLPPKLTKKIFSSVRKNEWDRKGQADKKQLTERKPSEKKIYYSCPPYYPEAKQHQERYDSDREQRVANSDYTAPWKVNSKAATATSVGRYHPPHFPPPYSGPSRVPQVYGAAPPGVEYSRFEPYGQVNFRKY